jgi:hypothetical protein
MALIRKIKTVETPRKGGSGGEIGKSGKLDIARFALPHRRFIRNRQGEDGLTPRAV